MSRLFSLILLLASLAFSDARDTVVTCTIHHPLKDVDFNSTKHYIQMDYKNSELTNLAFDVDAKYLTSGIEWIDKWSLKVIEWNKYDKIKFKSTSISKINSSTFMVTGIIDFHGVKKAISIPAKYDNKFLSGQFELYIMDFNIKKPRPFKIPIGDYATISYKILDGDK